ncbi:MULTISPECIES: PDZ domain-containing protein [Streptomyces]|uniref:PDZ domain-containing protein n=1 Tax=Streptomyces nigrescens TaxID=1920 RepID=A0ABY7ITQ9_STRNI|nr:MULTISPECIES: PDZ domain-containing protein [Streptomyces]AWN25001.1 PDZ domain-containing protein [Streptomyces sp. NEAU-S7GS2]MCX5450637.1 PDZ domain-containing protein [Streptomyces libani]WAU02205.1 PDZ domain-containing protein [Streptomyces nigrescens]WDT59770.1 PDZ domain-containing protein [Streptomyces sp. G7(2002)]
MAHPPQQNVPDLDAPGPAHTVVYPGDNKTRNYPIIVQIQAPQYTHITDIPIDCSGANCSISIAADGKSATVTITANTPMTSSRPFNVSVAADANAPLAGGQYSGSFTYDSDTTPLTVNITPGAPGNLQIATSNAPSNGGVRIQSVPPTSSGASAGLQPNDVITAIDGLPTPNIGTYYQVMNNYRVGATVPFTVQRGGQTITVQVTLEP